MSPCVRLTARRPSRPPTATPYGAGGPVATHPGRLQFSAPTYRVRENGVQATITVTRTDGSDGAVAVAYATSGGTAIVGRDYRPASGVLTFAAGVTTRTFTVGLLDDRTWEPTKTIGLKLSAPTGGATLGPATATLSILDNDTSINGMFWFSAVGFRTTEGGRVAFTVWRTQRQRGHDHDFLCHRQRHGSRSRRLHSHARHVDLPTERDEQGRLPSPPSTTALPRQTRRSGCRYTTRPTEQYSAVRSRAQGVIVDNDTRTPARKTANAAWLIALSEAGRIGVTAAC